MADRTAGRAVALGLLSKERESKGLKKADLGLHEQLCVLADAHAEEMAEHRHASHYGLDGRLPHQRYNSTKRGGVRSQVREFVYAEDDGGYVLGDEAQLENLVGKARAALQEAGGATAEHATGCAFGLCLNSASFRYVELILTDLVELDEVSCPDQLLTSELTLSGCVREAALGPCLAAVSYSAFPAPKTADELRSLPAPAHCDDFGEATASFGPRDIAYTLDGAFTLATFRVEDADLRPGSYHVRLFLRGQPDGIPYGERRAGVAETQVGDVCGAALQLEVDELHAAAHPVDQMQDDDFATLEEQAARHDAAAAAARPDGRPISQVAVLKGVGALPAMDANFEKAVYMPVERGEQLTTTNLAVAFLRLSPEEQPGDPMVIMDLSVVAVESEQAEPPDGFDVIEGNLLPDPFPGAERPDGVSHVYLCACYAPLSDAAGQAVVDVAVVYGAPVEDADDEAQPQAFDMGGGYETIELPDAVTRAYGCPVYVCIKREGAGRAAAERAAADRARAAAAQRALEDATGGFDNASGFGHDDDEDDDLLDTTLTPEQVRRLEQQRAEQLRESEQASDSEQRAKAAAASLEQQRGTLTSLREAKAELLLANADLQRRLGALLSTAKRDGSSKARVSADGAAASSGQPTSAEEGEKQYSDALSAILDSQRRAAKVKAEADREAYELQTRLDEKEFKAKKIAESFRDFKHEIALSAEHSRTCKPIPLRVIKQFEEFESKLESEVEKVRLKNIHLRMALRKLEASLRAKEQLAEGLHLIDFEQLKIENATLNEKIEDRNEELQKLRKKNTANVQVVTHFKEKLQFVVAANGDVGGTLRQLDDRLVKERDLVNSAKRDRDALRLDTAALKQQQGFANSDLLVVDYERRKVDLGRATQHIAELRERHALLHAEVDRATMQLSGGTAQ
ncbi:hypothetical protein M885DRAFT_518760 [Pelagophyceae sp. CCMP2097]|nr:hypothetical protein M885DRAFT_518760 [Pelagophyceae sp. CCMP2097]